MECQNCGTKQPDKQRKIPGNCMNCHLCGDFKFHMRVVAESIVSVVGHLGYKRQDFRNTETAQYPYR